MRIEAVADGPDPDSSLRVSGSQGRRHGQERRGEGGDRAGGRQGHERERDEREEGRVGYRGGERDMMRARLRCRPCPGLQYLGWWECRSAGGRPGQAGPGM